MKRTLMRTIITLSALLLLSACAALVTPVVAVEGLSAVGTGKPLSDHVVSYYSGKDCSSVRRNTGRSYCEEEELNPTPNVFCYRTLGRVSCYSRPDPHDGNQRQMGDNSHNVDTQ